MVQGDESQLRVLFRGREADPVSGPRLPSAALPLFAALVTGALTLWDLYNDSIIEKMGMAWDTGPPPWPYQAPDVLLRLINLPAYAIGMPVASLLHLTDGAQHLVVFPLAIALWTFVGLGFADKLIARDRIHHWAFYVGVAILAVLLVPGGAYGLFVAAVWWHTYGSASLSSAVLALRFLTLTIWAAVFLCFIFRSTSPRPQ